MESRNEQANKAEDLFEKELNRIESQINRTVEKINHIKGFIDRIENQDPSFKIIFNHILDEEKMLKSFTKLRLPIIGKANVGKSSLVNTLLLEDILEMGKKITTRFVLIIKHTPKATPELWKCKINRIKLTGGSYITEFTEAGGTFVANSIGKIKSEMKKKNMEMSSNSDIPYSSDERYMILKCNIPFLNDLPESLRYRIEIIDCPGLNELNFVFKEMLDVVLSGVHFFLYITTYEDFQIGDEKNTMEGVLKELGSSVDNFNLILNKLDLKSEEEAKPYVKEVESHFRTEILANKDISIKAIHYSSQEKLKLFSLKEFFDEQLNICKRQRLHIDFNEYLNENLKKIESNLRRDNKKLNFDENKYNGEELEELSNLYGIEYGEMKKYTMLMEYYKNGEKSTNHLCKFIETKVYSEYNRYFVHVNDILNYQVKRFVGNLDALLIQRNKEYDTQPVNKLKGELLDEVYRYTNNLDRKMDLLRMSIKGYWLKDSLFVKSIPEIEAGLKDFDERLAKDWEVYNNDLSEIHQRYNEKFDKTIQKIYKQLERMSVLLRFNKEDLMQNCKRVNFWFKIGEQKIKLTTMITGIITGILGAGGSGVGAFMSIGARVLTLGLGLTGTGFVIGTVAGIGSYCYAVYKESQEKEWKETVNDKYTKLMLENIAIINDQKEEVKRLREQILSNLNAGCLAHINKFNLDKEELKKSLKPIVYVRDELKKLYEII
jgi:GTPase SAR1 family protein